MTDEQNGRRAPATGTQELGGPGTSRPEPPEEQEPEFFEMLEDLPGGGEYKIGIMRYPEGGGEREWLEKWPADGFELDAVRQKFGGGKYQFRLLDAGGRYVKAKTVRLAGRPKPWPRPEPEPEPGPYDSPAGGGAAMIAELRRLSDRFEQMYRDLRQPDPRYQEQNPADLFASMMTAVNSATEPLRDAFRELSQRDRHEESAVVSALLKGLEIGASRSQGNGYDSVIDRLGVPLLEYLQGQGNTAPGPPSSLANPPADATTMIDSSKLAEKRPRWVNFLAPYVPALLTMAERGLTPELRAAVLLDEIPGGLYPQIHDELSRDGFRDEFFAAVQGADAHREWLMAFFDAAVRELSPEDPDD